MKFIYHISDIHIRNQDRHEEYRQVFKNLRNEIKKDTNEKIIVITGDIFHEKCNLSPESIILFKEFITRLNKLGTIIIIDGNHDVNINNDKRKSGIFASLKRLNTSGSIHYLNHDNLSVKIENMNFILTVMDKQVLKIENKNENEIYIGLYHGTLYKSKIDNGYEIDNEKYIKASDFEEYNIVMLGDIHKHQYMNKEKTIAYASSLIQQNYGESVDKHGIIKWDIEKKQGEFIEIHNEIAYIKCNLTKEGFKILGDIKTKSKLHVEINYETECREMIEEELKKLKEKYEILSYRYNEIKKVKKDDEQEEEKLNKNIIEIYKELMRKHEQEEDKDVMDILEKYIITKMNHREIKLIKMEFENLFSYGKKSTVEFSDMSGIITIIGDNGAGKSSLIDAILFCLYDEFSKGNGRDALNISKITGYCDLWIKVNNVEYKIERKITKTTSTVKLFKGDENISNNNKKNTEKDIVELFGDYTLLNSICISLQDGVNLLNTNDSNKMKMFYNLLNINQYEEIKKEIDFKKTKLSRNMSSVQKEMDTLFLILENEELIKEQIIINNENIGKMELVLTNEVKEINNLEYELEKIDKTKFYLIQKKILECYKKIKEKELQIKKNKKMQDDVEKINLELEKIILEKNNSIEKDIDIVKIKKELNNNIEEMKELNVSLKKNKNKEFDEKNIILKLDELECNEKIKNLNIEEDECVSDSGSEISDIFDENDCNDLDSDDNYIEEEKITEQKITDKYMKKININEEDNKEILKKKEMLQKIIINTKEELDKFEQNKKIIPFYNYINNLSFEQKCIKCNENKNMIKNLEVIKNTDNNNNTPEKFNKIIKKHEKDISLLDKQYEINKENIHKYRLNIKEEINNLHINIIKKEQYEKNKIQKEKLKQERIEQNTKLLKNKKEQYEKNRIQKEKLKNEMKEQREKIKREYELIKLERIKQHEIEKKNKKQEYEINKKKIIMDLEEKIKNCEINIKKLNEIQNDYNLIMYNKSIDIKINNKKKEKNEILKEMECPIKTNNEYILLLKDKENLDNTEKQQLIFNEMEYKLNILMKNSNLTKEELKKLLIIKDDLNRSIGEIIMTRKIHTEKNEIITNIKNEYVTMIKIIDLYNKYEMMNYLLNKYITQLEQIINNILMSIVSYKIKIIQENTELRIYKLEKNITINTRQLSGNEKFLINIAFKCALNKMAISYKSDFIIIDEGFGSFDSDKLNKISELFDVLKKEFDKCIIISHLDKIKNMNNTVLRVKRDEKGYSKII